MANKNDDVLRRIAALEAEIGALKASVQKEERPRHPSSDLDQWLGTLDAGDNMEEVMEKAAGIAERAEKLLDGLPKKRKLVSYAKAYELLFDEAPVPFRNAIHVRRVLEVATRTAPRVVDGLETRLDSLIVSMRSRQPGPGHFRTAPYTLDEWRSVFGGWSLVQ